MVADIAAPTSAAATTCTAVRRTFPASLRKPLLRVIVSVVSCRALEDDAGILGVPERHSGAERIKGSSASGGRLGRWLNSG
jgi:hypothetical protein